MQFGYRYEVMFVSGSGSAVCLPDSIQHGLPGGAALLPHPPAGGRARPQAQGRLRGGLLDRHPLPDGWPARLHRGRLSLCQGGGLELQTKVHTKVRKHGEGP